MQEIPNFHKHAMQSIQELNELLNQAKESNRLNHAIKVVELKMRLHQMVHKSLDPALQLQQLDIDDVPPECLQKWLKQLKDYRTNGSESQNGSSGQARGKLEGV